MGARVPLDFAFKNLPSLASSDRMIMLSIQFEQQIDYVIHRMMFINCNIRYVKFNLEGSELQLKLTHAKRKMF